MAQLELWDAKTTSIIPKNKGKKIYRFKAYDMEFICLSKYVPKFASIDDIGRIHIHKVKPVQNRYEFHSTDVIFIGNLINKETSNFQHCKNWKHSLIEIPASAFIR